MAERTDRLYFNDFTTVLSVRVVCLFSCLFVCLFELRSRN